MADTITEILESVETLGHMLSTDMGFYDETWGSLSCAEAEAFADLFHKAGFHALADSIVEQHGFHDEEGDQHYNPENAELHKRLHGQL